MTQMTPPQQNQQPDNVTQAQRLIAAYETASVAQMDQVLAIMARQWAAMPGFRDVDMAQWVAQTVPLITGAQANLAHLTDAYLATLSGLVTGAKSGPVGIPSQLVTDAAMRGVTAQEVYSRVGKTIWYQMSQGKDVATAARIGFERAKDMAATDMQLARTHAALYSMAIDTRIKGYLRVPDAGACSFCVLISTRLYHKSDLMPVHPYCQCGIMPVYVGVPAEKSPDLGPADQTDRPGDPVIKQHGEIGPVIVTRGNHFRGPSQVPVTVR